MLYNYEKAASFVFLCCEIMVDWPEPHTASKRIALKVLHGEGEGHRNRESGTRNRAVDRLDWSRAWSYVGVRTGTHNTSTDRNACGCLVHVIRWEWHDTAHSIIVG